MAQVAQSVSEGPVPGNVRGQVGWDSQQPDPVMDVPDYCRGVGLDGF